MHTTTSALLPSHAPSGNSQVWDDKLALWIYNGTLTDHDTGCIVAKVIAIELVGVLPSIDSSNNVSHHKLIAEKLFQGSESQNDAVNTILFIAPHGFEYTIHARKSNGGETLSKACTQSRTHNNQSGEGCDELQTFFRSAGLGSVRSRRKRDDHHAPNKAPTSPQKQHELDDEHITINSIKSPATAHRSKCWHYVFFTTATPGTSAPPPSHRTILQSLTVSSSPTGQVIRLTITISKRLNNSNAPSTSSMIR
jgi:hypothetical protein